MAPYLYVSGTCQGCHLCSAWGATPDPIPYLQTENFAGGMGGGLVVDTRWMVKAVDVSFTSNTCENGPGAAVYIIAGFVSFVNLKVDGNVAEGEPNDFQSSGSFTCGE